jgi:hypothetical protein|tara:strand:+ start:473 stop:1078 length:606 start_codon:yes stop_codon:yes gene_type:complete
MREFKIRASASGKLAVNPRSKSEALSKTTKSYVQEWLAGEIYGVRKQIKSKYLDKGNAVEDAAIDYASEELGWLFAIKNEEYFEDEYFCGTPDVMLEDKIIDIKSSWDCFTFPLFDEEIPNKDYFYQLQVYMHLTGKRKAQLCYVLMNTPEDLAYGETEDYTDIDSKYRIKTFDIDYDEEVIEMLQEKVLISRKYIKDITK